MLHSADTNPTDPGLGLQFKAMKNSTRREMLRAGTAAAHAALEADIGPICSTASYLAYVRGLYVFRASVETAIAALPWPRAWSHWSATCIAEDLAADLRDLGGELHFEVVAPSLINDIDDLLGALYVLEGSSLGARVLIKSAAMLGFHGTHGARHLERQVSALGNWKAFVETLEVSPAIDICAVVASAERTFDCARTSMRRPSFASKVS